MIYAIKLGEMTQNSDKSVFTLAEDTSDRSHVKNLNN